MTCFGWPPTASPARIKVVSCCGNDVYDLETTLAPLLRLHDLAVIALWYPTEGSCRQLAMHPLKISQLGSRHRANASERM